MQSWVQRQREGALHAAREEAAASRADATQAKADFQRKNSELQSARAQAQAAAVYEQQVVLLRREKEQLQSGSTGDTAEKQQMLQAALEAADRHRV
jgi:hypothetical protein